MGATCALQFDACGELAVPIAGGGCTAVGVPKDGCAPGFDWADGGCVPILPEAACKDGELALPGDKSCHLVAPCGVDPFGDPPADALFVDVAAAVDGDGSRDKPLRSIVAALAKATTDGVVAVAAGTYPETVIIERRVTLRGRCPSMVHLVGQLDVEDAALVVTVPATVSGFSITGPKLGVYAPDPFAIVLERLHVHDTGDAGIELHRGVDDATRFILRDLLVERATDLGISVRGAAADLERVVVRDTAPGSTGKFGNGLRLEAQVADGQFPDVSVRASVFERNFEVGIAVLASTARLDAVVVNDTRPRKKDGGAGDGVLATWHEASRKRSSLTVTRSSLARNRAAGVYVEQSDATLEKLTVRDTLPRASEASGGHGVLAFDGAVVDLRDLLVERSVYAGIVTWNATMVGDRILVRDTVAGVGETPGGFGYALVADDGLLGDGRVVFRSSLSLRNVNAGFYVSGISARLEGIASIGTLQLPAGNFGDGLVVAALPTPSIVYPALVELRASYLGNNARAGAVALGATLHLQGTSLRCNQIDLDVERTIGVRATTGEPVTSDYKLDDLGDNACGCGQPTDCKAQSSSLARAEPIRR